ncbi:MAG: nucleoside hydrolase [Chloroflexota bacterium]
MKVLFDHDGGIDDLISLMMLLAMEDVELAGVVVTPADSFLRPAMSATLKILRFFERPDIPVCSGTGRGVNPFPREWRKAPYAVDALPILNDSEAELATPLDEPGHEWIARILKDVPHPIHVLVTGPLSNLSMALCSEPSLASTIKEVIWMGGALNVRGNVQDYEHDGSAEWNAYWDPPAAYDIFHKTAVPITLFPLDVTDSVPVSMDFLQTLARQRRYPLSDLAGQCWAMTVGTIPAYEYIYHMWDVLSTGYFLASDLMTFRDVHCQIHANGPSAGRTELVESGGRLIRVAETVDVAAFHGYLLTLFRR